jgi:hypothetical protein
MEENQRADGNSSNEEVFSKSVKAGKRTYYFDVKTTKKNDFYLTITERKKRIDENGQFQIEKHKIFLYKEDFTKFTDILNEAMEYIEDSVIELDLPKEKNDNFTDISFDDLEIN